MCATFGANRSIHSGALKEGLMVMCRHVMTELYNYVEMLLICYREALGIQSNPLHSFAGP